MKKLLLFLTVLLLVGCQSPSLSSKGYSKDEITIINQKLDENIINNLLKKDYISVLTDILNSDDFDINNLDKYIDYYQNNKSVSGKNNVILVNKNIDYEYSDIINKIMGEKYFVPSNITRYIDYSLQNNLPSDEIVKQVNANLDSDFYTNTRSADLSKDYLILVNKYYYLDKDYEPDDLVFIESKYSMKGYLRKDAYDAFMKMVKAALEQNLYLINTSPYRSYQTQNNLYNGYIKSEGMENAERSSARPGYSEHQTGLALDLKTPNESMYEFGNTKEGQWTALNAHKYGFILRYKDETEYITGYQSEPWHYRYVGIEAAEYIYNNNITLEEYYEYFVK